MRKESENDFEFSWRNYPCIISARTPAKIYPHIKYEGRYRQESHVSYKLFYGEYPKNYACHRCDQPRCMEPRHLFDGTAKQNMVDCSIKGRIAHGDSHLNTVQFGGRKKRILDLYVNGCSVAEISKWLDLGKGIAATHTYRYRRSFGLTSQKRRSA